MKLMTLIISLGVTAVGLFLFSVLAAFLLPVFWG
jgi:hypothetical protein